MLRPGKMKSIELTILKSDIDTVLEFLGKKGVIHFPDSQSRRDNPDIARVRHLVERLISAAVFTGIDLEKIEEAQDRDEVRIPGENDETLANDICLIMENLKEKQMKALQEKHSISETLNEARAFSRMNIPFSDLDQLSYLTLRIGRLDQKGQAELRENLKDRAIIIPLSDDDKILAATSRKGRFTMDSQLKKVSFEPTPFPKDFKGIPSDMLKGLEEQLERVESDLYAINNEKEKYRSRAFNDFKRLITSWKMALVMEEIKSNFTVTENFYNFTGWIPAEKEKEVSNELTELTAGRIAIKSYSPDEVYSVTSGREKVPVFVKHGAFASGFKGLVFSYGAPLYGTIDPTPLVAFFFTLLFGIMFGDIGHGFTLLLAGILIKKIPKLKEKFSGYSTPLVSIGISSMFFGILFGSVFTNESLLIAPTRFISGAVTGNPVDRFVSIMPLEETGGSLMKLLYFFGFTVAIGAILISAGLLINIINRCILRKYEEAFFSRTGLAGLFLFWYALSIAVRMILGGSFAWFDTACLVSPVVIIFFGPVIWRLFAGKRPVFEHGVMTFIMEGFVELLETISGYVSNTVSFLRVGAFALSHTVLSFIVFTFSEMMIHSGIAGSVGAGILLIFGNALIIVLEGMIVAIQVVRLQYYEFFNKFFVETGVEYSPFRFNTRKV